MAPEHLDRLTPVDASFLHQEGPVSHMHIGGLTLVEGPPPGMEEFLEQIRRRLHLVPRYRHKLAHTAIDSGRRSGWTTPASTSSTTCATPRCPRPAPSSSFRS